MKKRLEHGLKADLSADSAFVAEATSAKEAVLTKAEKRDIKKRPRMKMHGASLRRPSKYSGLAAIKSRKK